MVRVDWFDVERQFSANIGISAGMTHFHRRKENAGSYWIHLLMISLNGTQMGLVLIQGIPLLSATFVEIIVHHSSLYWKNYW